MACLGPTKVTLFFVNAIRSSQLENKSAQVAAGMQTDMCLQIHVDARNHKDICDQTSGRFAYVYVFVTICEYL